MTSHGVLAPSGVPRRPLFIAGTDTGAGKTVLTALLLHHLRACGQPACGLKPFCTGPRHDVRILRRAQQNGLTADQINPFWFGRPLAPCEAARQEGRRVTLSRALHGIKPTLRCSRWTLIEGCGGLLTPLGPRFTNADLIAAVEARVLLATPNRLGAINCTLLALNELRRRRIRCLAVVCVNMGPPDAAARSNPSVIRRWAGGVPVMVLPFLGPDAVGRMRRNALRIRPLLEMLCGLARAGTRNGKRAEI